MATDAKQVLLKVEGVSAAYDSHQVLEDVSLDVRDGEFLGIIGHNGAGKSTLLKVMASFMKVTAGHVNGASSNGTNIRIGMVPQGLSVFPRMTVAENLAIPELSAKGARDLVPVEEVIELFPILGERTSQAAGNLSGGEQRMVAIAMALRLEPQLLLLDEPSLGLAPMLAHGIVDAVDEARRRFGYSVVVVEQNLDILLRRTDRLLALRQGELVWEGKPDEITDTRTLWEHF